jgi:hypothetical protein
LGHVTRRWRRGDQALGGRRGGHFGRKRQSATAVVAV